jgi:hypothetical protein
VSRDLVCSYSAEELALLSKSEAVRVHPSAPVAMNGSVQVFLIVLAAFDKTDVRQFGYVLCASGGDVAGKHSDNVTLAINKSFRGLLAPALSVHRGDAGKPRYEPRTTGNP